MTVAVILSQKGNAVISTAPTTTVGEVAKLLSSHRIGAVLVVGRAGGLDGILSERDVVRAIGQHGADALNLSVSSVMTSRVITCARDDSIPQIMQKMTEGKFRHMPVVEDGELLGVISIGDVVKHRVAAAVAEAEQLREYINSA